MTWHPIPDWSGYELNADGDIRSWKRGRPRPLITKVGSTGYLRARLYDGFGQFKWRPVHHLVAEVFHGTRPEGAVIRHLDGNKLNNRAENLRYGTAAENIQDSVDHGTHWQVIKTHCPAGHPYDERNTYWANGRHRSCRPCTNAAGYRSKARKRAGRITALEPGICDDLDAAMPTLSTSATHTSQEQDQ